MNLDNLNKVLDSTSEETKAYVKTSMDILDRIHELLDEKFDGRQKLLAEKMGKSEAEVSKWLNGIQNFTTKTLVKLQLAFGEPITAVCSKGYDNSTFELVRTPYNKPLAASWAVDEDGSLATYTSDEIKAAATRNIKEVMGA